MPSWEIRLIAASYAREPDVTIELYGKTRSGKSVVVLYSDFKPYFHVLAPPDVVKKILANDDEVVCLEGCELFHKGEWHNGTKIVMRHPWLVPRYREKFRGFTVLAADIPFAQRFIYDFDLGACVRVSGEVVENHKYTTDMAVKAEKFENCDPFIPPLKILSFDIENSLETGRIFVIGCVLKHGDQVVKKHFTGDERETILNFVRFVQESDPDIITGYNVDGYDLPVIADRLTKLGMSGALRLARDKSVAAKMRNRFWRIRGRVLADAWWNVKNELRPKQETLNYVAKVLLGEEKEDVDPTRIDEEWKRSPDSVINYCVKDAELALRILEKINVIEKYMDLATVSKLPFDDVINSGTSTLIDSILIREADRNKVGVPMTHQGGGRRAIEGGYVHTISPGIYHWVCVLDFKSMYPSIIITKNICFTTLSPEGTIVSPTGDRFLDKSVREGLLPRILTALMQEREKAKEKMKLAASAEEKDYYNRLQNAIKILMNAFYGVFASSFYRFTNPRIGASITAFGRENIKRVITELENEKIKVIYSDTDSVFVQSPYSELEKTVKFGTELSQRFSGDGIVLEFEKIIEPLFSHGKKKRYVGRVVWPKHDVIVRGYEIRRTDAFDLQSEALAKVFNEILNNNPEGAVRVAKEIVTKVLNGDVAVEKLVISRTCKSFREYKDPDSQANVQAARKLKELGYEFVPGMKVAWVVVDSKRTPQVVEPYIVGREFKFEPDWEYYARRVAATLARATEVFGWNEESLLTGTVQSTLFERHKKSVRKAVPKITKKRLTLEDFM